MTYAVKRKIVLAGLVVVTAWPAVHHGLVRALDLNPWHWFGWSMYTVPPPEPGGLPLFPARSKGLATCPAVPRERTGPDARL